MQLSNQARRHIAVNAAIASTQVLIYQALHDRYGFGRGRFAKIDTAVDEYSRNINHDGEVMIPEFMKCMTLECGQKFENLESWEKKYGELRIYG